MRVNHCDTLLANQTERSYIWLTQNHKLLTVYDAEAELLTGTIGSEDPFEMTAYSGGSRGHSDVSANTAKKYLHKEATSMWSKFANTQTIGHGTNANPYKQRGGTLPPGHYSCIYMASHPTFGHCIQLKRDADTHIRYPTMTGSLDNRGDDFFIHGHGPKGSDGCIVPEDNSERKRLNKAVKNFTAGGAGVVILQVKNVAYVLPAERGGIFFA